MLHCVIWILDAGSWIAKTKSFPTILKTWYCDIQRPKEKSFSRNATAAIPAIWTIEIKSLKLWIGEEAEYDKVIARYKSEGLGDNWSENMRIVPVNFNKEHKAMLGHCKMILESEGGRIAINPDRFETDNCVKNRCR
jgi:hypothetical protein